MVWVAIIYTVILVFIIDNSSQGICGLYDSQIARNLLYISYSISISHNTSYVRLGFTLCSSILEAKWLLKNIHLLYLQTVINCQYNQANKYLV